MLMRCARLGSIYLWFISARPGRTVAVSDERFISARSRVSPAAPTTLLIRVMNHTSVDDERNPHDDLAAPDGQQESGGTGVQRMTGLVCLAPQFRLRRLRSMPATDQGSDGPVDRQRLLHSDQA